MEKLKVLLSLPSQVHAMARKFVNSAAVRNCQPILDVLMEELRPVQSHPAGRELAAGREGTVLEISSGSGQHVVHFAPHFPQLTFIPSEVDGDNMKSIRGYLEDSGLGNVSPPVYVDASQPCRSWADGLFSPGSLSAIININMMHITPFACSEGLFKGAGELLAPSGRLLTYGPYAYNGIITPDSNVQFDKSLRSRDSSWGLRDVHRELEPLAQKAGLSLLRIHRLPANNQLLVWEKNGPAENE